MAFITTAQLKTSLAALLNQAEASMPDKYTNSILSEAVNAAYGAIVRALIRRGYTKAQVDLWVDGAEFNRDIGLYWALLKGNALDRVEQGEYATWKGLDRRKELDTVEVLNSSYVPIVPAGSRVVIGGGAMSTTNDLIRMDDSSDPDPRRGEITEW